MPQIFCLQLFTEERTQSVRPIYALSLNSIWTALETSTKRREKFASILCLQNCSLVLLISQLFCVSCKLVIFHWLKEERRVHCNFYPNNHGNHINLSISIYSMNIIPWTSTNLLFEEGKLRRTCWSKWHKAQAAANLLFLFEKIKVKSWWVSICIQCPRCVLCWLILFHHWSKALLRHPCGHFFDCPSFTASMYINYCLEYLTKDIFSSTYFLYVMRCGTIICFVKKVWELEI